MYNVYGDSALLVSQLWIVNIFELVIAPFWLSTDDAYDSYAINVCEIKSVYEM